MFVFYQLFNIIRDFHEKKQDSEYLPSFSEPAPEAEKAEAEDEPTYGYLRNSS